MSRFIIVFLGCFLLPSSFVFASGPSAIVGLVDTAVFSPTAADAKTAKEVRIEGWFMLYNKSTRGYDNPKEGLFRFECNQHSVARCRLEWADLQKNVGQKACIGFSDAYSSRTLPTMESKGTRNPTLNTYNHRYGMGVRNMEGTKECKKLRAAVAAAKKPAPREVMKEKDPVEEKRVQPERGVIADASNPRVPDTTVAPEVVMPTEPGPTKETTPKKEVSNAEKTLNKDVGGNQNNGATGMGCSQVQADTKLNIFYFLLFLGFGFLTWRRKK